MHLVPMFCPREEDLATFSQEIHKLSLKHCEIFKKGEFKHERLFRYLRIRLLEKFLRMQKLLEIRQVAKKLWKALPFPPPPRPLAPSMSMFFNLIGKLTMTFFTVKGQSWRVLKSCISCRLISREKKFLQGNIIPGEKSSSYTEKNISPGVWLWKKSYSAAVVCQEKKILSPAGLGENILSPPNHPYHPLPINVKWSAVPSVPLLLGSSVP